MRSHLPLPATPLRQTTVRVQAILEFGLLSASDETVVHNYRFITTIAAENIANLQLQAHYRVFGHN